MIWALTCRRRPSSTRSQRSSRRWWRLSGFLTLAFDSMKETVAAIEAAGLRDGVKIMVGGGTVDEQVCKYAGADAFGADAMAAVTLAKVWIIRRIIK